MAAGAMNELTLLKVWQISGPRPKNAVAPSSFGGWIWAVVLRVLLLVGFMLGQGGTLILVIMLERITYATIHDSLPAPSEVPSRPIWDLTWRR